VVHPGRVRWGSAPLSKGYLLRACGLGRRYARSQRSLDQLLPGARSDCKTGAGGSSARRLFAQANLACSSLVSDFRQDGRTYPTGTPTKRTVAVLSGTFYFASGVLRRVLAGPSPHRRVVRVVDGKRRHLDRAQPLNARTVTQDREHLPANALRIIRAVDRRLQARTQHLRERDIRGCRSLDIPPSCGQRSSRNRKGPAG
jgi:hypothetical protein